MSVYIAGKTFQTVATKKCLKEIFLTFKRFKESRYLGYYKHKLSTPVYEKRKEVYRKTVLRPLEEIPTLEERLAELNAPDLISNEKVDIGFRTERRKVSMQERLAWRKSLAERKATVKENERVEVDLSVVHNEWKAKDGCLHLKNVAEHYGIFSHLYDHGYFLPCVPLEVSFDFDEDSVNMVSMGNILGASETKDEPNILFPSDSNSLWTLVLTNLDGHLLDTNAEYLHWFIGNIKGNDLKSGDVICNYLRPFPMRGTGYHRLVFVLYKQEKHIDYSSMKRIIPCLSLKERTFKTFEFYKEYQDIITPAGLSFFQCTWDESLTDFFHNVLNMREPVFEYIEKPIQHKPQVHYPHLQSFNVYLDRYRDPKEIKKEVLLKRLKLVEPFKEEAPMPKYPCLHKPDNYRFSWQAEDMKLQRLRLGKYRDLRPHSAYPQEDNQYPLDTKC